MPEAHETHHSPPPATQPALPRAASGDSRTVRQARAVFFRESGFAPDGGYGDEWNEAEFGWLRYRVPNTPARAAVLRRHDLHHVLTGYPATWQGEAVISAWELAAGAGPISYAWIIALWGLFTGLVGLPVATAQAFLRGRDARSLYGQDLASVDLDQTVAELQQAQGVETSGGSVERSWSQRLGDLTLLALWSVLAVGFSLTVLPFTLAFALHGSLEPALQGASGRLHSAWRAATTSPCCCPLRWSATS